MTTLTSPITELPTGFRPLLRSEFEHLVQLGVFGDARVELVGGVLIDVPPMNPPHAGMLYTLNKRFILAAGDDHVVGTQGPLAVDLISEPLPDFMILPLGIDYHRVLPEKAHLVVEVSDSTLRFDLGEKARRYAMAGYPEYWVVDVNARVVHVHREPRPDGSWASIVQQATGSLHAVAAPPIAVDLDTLWP